MYQIDAMGVPTTKELFQSLSFFENSHKLNGFFKNLVINFLGQINFLSTYKYIQCNGFNYTYYE